MPASHHQHDHSNHAHSSHAQPHHGHPPGTRHPAAVVGPSLLRMSAFARLALVLPVAVLLWAAALAVLWGGA